ncbi:unnamed protein product [Caenorhabditis auriculariae]|uniref:Major facilitator superfamily (MFS) profile domain-containing protein n=1 Tax=Caenorhabditis auriculariae TaxID=2777116 RepID=A0A8S1H0L4_9PELO|nr:unnamed protein product [Caenorhabditis auriculariae]
MTTLWSKPVALSRFFRLYIKMAGKDPIAVLIFKLPPLWRLIVVLTGAVLIHLTIGTYHTFGNMLPYMASYMRTYTDPTVRLEHMMWIPTFQGCFPFAMVIGGIVASKLGPRTASFIGCALATFGVGFSAYAIRHSFLLFFLSYGMIYGIGMGIAYVTAVATVINWAPDKIGLVSGIVAAGFGLSSSIFAPIQTMLVNPKNLPATKEGYFVQEELLQRVPDVFLSLAFIYGLMQLIAVIVVCDPPEKETEIEASSSVRRRSLSRGSSDSDDDVFSRNPEARTAEEIVSLSPKEMLSSSTFYFLFISLFCCSFYANMFYNLYKTFGETFIEDDFFFAVAFSVGSVANAAARIGWGYLTDRTSFQVSLSTATCLASVFLLTMPLTRDLGRFFYFLWLVGTFICMGATHALYITATVKCFGTRHKAKNYGYLIFSTTLSGVLLAAVSQYYLQVIGYTWLFVVTSIFPFSAFLIIASIQYTPQGGRVT